MQYEWTERIQLNINREKAVDVMSLKQLILICLQNIIVWRMTME